MNKKIILLSIAFIIATNLKICAQNDSIILRHHLNALQQYYEATPIEKVHLQLDKSWYSLGDTLWFKAYVVIGGYHQLSALSGVLYLELINPGDSVLQRTNVRLNFGTGMGNLIIPYTYKSGIYRLKAYTNWMRNDSSDYFFDKKIIIGGIKPQPQTAQVPKSVSTSSERKLPQNSMQGLDMQFFPEGGNLINGLRSKIAFKVVSKDGLPIAVTGVVTDEANDELASFATQHEGMGQFALNPKAGGHYKAKINCPDGSSYFFELPKASDQGFTLAISNVGDSLHVKIAANDVLYRSNTGAAFYLLGLSAGKYYFTTQGKLTNKVFTASIDKKRFPSGIAQFTLFSQNGEPINERIVFIENDDALKLSLASEKLTYAPKEKVTIALSTKDKENKNITGTFSVAVTDETKVPVDEQAENTIFTDILLTSELKGFIQNPNYYFIDNSEKRRSDLDLLMLTQGYRRFVWKKILSSENPKAAFEAEASLSLSGIIKTTSGKGIPNGKVRLTSIKYLFAIDTLSDANGNFKFTGIDLPDTAKVVINAKKTNGSNNVMINITPPSYPIAINTGNFSKNYSDTNIPEPVRTTLQKAYLAGQQKLDKNVIQLNEVKIKHRRNNNFDPAYSENMKHSANLNGPGNANQILLAEKLGNCSNLATCLIGKLGTVRFSAEGIPINIRKQTKMAVIIDGVFRGQDELNYINPADVYSIEVLTSVAYLTIYGSTASGGALIITMKQGSGVKDTNRQVDGLITYMFKGFTKVREFYSPKYDVKRSAIMPDDRKTIYWAPDIITDANGKASLEYFNADGKGLYRVVVEGIDEKGNLGRQVFRYKVE